MRRRPKPLRELDGRARAARLRLEQEIYRPRLVRLELRVTPKQLARMDAERRVPDARGVPSRRGAGFPPVDEAKGAAASAEGRAVFYRHERFWKARAPLTSRLLS